MDSTNRSHFSQLPSIKETEEIISREAKRDLPESKKNKHYPDFNPVADWLESVYIDANIFRVDCSWQEALSELEAMKQELVEKTLMMKVEPQSVTEYLNECDEPEKADIIMLFGSNSKKRVEKTWEIWQKDLADKIIISGGKPNYIKNNEPSEARVFEEDLIALGVPKDKIVVEDKSITIPDNVRTSMNLMDSMKIEYKSVILVLAWFAMRRAWMHWMKYGEDTIKIYKTCAEIIDPNLSPENWWKNELGIKTIFDQFVKMKVAVAMNTA